VRIVLDLQGAQTESRFRGIGRYTFFLTQAITRQAGEHEIILALNGLFPDTIEPVRAAFDGLVPQENIRVWQASGPVREMDPANTWRRLAAERLREAFLAGFKPDVVYVSSLFEGFIDNAVTSIGTFANTLPTAVTLYDLIPLIYRETYLSNPIQEAYYERKLDHLRRAQLWLAISESSRREGIDYLGLQDEWVVNISTAADVCFRSLDLPKNTVKVFQQRYGIVKPFIMYTGGFDSRKNLDRLLNAYSKLPVALRSGYHLVIVGKITEGDMASLRSHARVNAIAQDEVIFTGYVNDDDLVALYNLCTVFVFPSWHEGFGLPALEAMACGAAVIGANTSSLPEVIGRADALFDPYDEAAITTKLAQVLTDESFRAELKRHGLKQAKMFSWDRSARCALDAFTRLHKARQKVDNIHVHCVKFNRPSMAYVSPLPPEKSGVADYSAELLPELARHYKIDVIVNQREITDPWIKANCHVRSVEWFAANSYKYDRVLYHFGNSPFHQHMFGLLEKHSGVVVLHDFFLSNVFACMEEADYNTHSWAWVLYWSHGYQAVRELFQAADKADVALKYPCNLSVLQQALGIIVHTDSFRYLATKWYGKKITRDWHVIPHCNHNIPRQIVDQYAQAIEYCYQNPPLLRYRLMQSIVALDDGPNEEEPWFNLTQAVTDNLPLPQPQRQLLVDVSELVQRDAKSGIQRVVRSILQELFEHPPTGFRVEPVYATENLSYRYARCFTLKFLDCPEDGLADDPVELYPGDCFLGLDLQSQIVPKQREFLIKARNFGVSTFFVVYDLLSVYRPDCFTEGARDVHTKWLRTVAQGDGALCISRAVADELKEWLDNNQPERYRPFKIGWFHLGADIDASLPTTGLPDDFNAQLIQLGNRPGVLMVGTVEPRKGHAQALAAFELLWAQGVEANLVIVGKQGWMMEGLVKRINQHPEQGRRLFWYQGISDEGLLKLYEASTGVLMASEGEGFGLPLIEAARHCRPILARDIPVFREVAGDYASYFSGNTPEAMAEALKKWLASLQAGTAPASEGMPWQTWADSTKQIVKLLTDSNHPNWIYRWLPGSTANELTNKE